MKIIDSDWNDMDLVKPELHTSVIILFEGKEYITRVSEFDLYNNNISVYGDPLLRRICSKLWKYLDWKIYENN